MDAAGEQPSAVPLQCSVSGSTAGAHHQPESMPLELLLHAAAKQGHKVPGQQQQQQKLLAGLSHLHLNGLQLTELHSLRPCPSLQVLYLYDNQLSSIEAISSSRQLTHLYCHNNQLTSLKGLQHLPLLQKLYVQHNRLACIDCLTSARHLEELHVSDQHPASAAAGQQHQQQRQRHSGAQVLQVHDQGPAEQRRQQQQQQQQQQADEHCSNPTGPQAVRQQQQLVLYNDGCLMQHAFDSTPPTPPTPLTAQHDFEAAASTGLAASGTSNSSNGAASTLGGLWFEPASLAAVAGSLRVLGAANCGIADPGPLTVLTQLQVLDLSGNDIASLSALQPVLAALHQLLDLDLRRNPCTTSDPKYRDRIILASADCLQQLDGEEVKPAHRAFLQALHSRRARARRQQLLAGQQEQLSQQASSMHLGCDASTGAAAAAAAGQLNMQRTEAVDETQVQVVSGVKVQLATALQPCRAGAARPTGAAGFKPSPKMQRRAHEAAGGGAAALGGCLGGNAVVQQQGPLIG